MNSNQNIFKFPPLLEPEKDFCHFPRKYWYNNSKQLPKEGHDKKFKIILVRPSSLGDVLFLTPIVKAIKKKFPNCDIQVNTIHKQILEENPNIAVIANIKEDFLNTDYIYFLSYEFTPHLHPVEAYARIVGIEVEDYKPEIYLKEQEVKQAKEFLDAKNVKRKFIIIHDECIWHTRRWGQWAKFIALFMKHHPEYSVLRVGTAKSNNYVGVIDIAGDTPLIRHLAAIILHADFCVTIDSGIMHMAVAMNRPAFSIFTIIDPNKRLPDRWLDMSSQIRGEYAGYQHRRFIPAETEPTLEFQCISMLQNFVSPLEVLSKVDQFIKNRSENLFSILIPSYNKAQLNYKAVMSIILKSSSWNYEIITGDDGSPPLCKESLHTIGRLTEIKFYSENCGYTKLCNKMVSETKSKYIVLLNNDTELLSDNWISELENNFKTDPNVGIIGAKLLFPNMTIQHAGMVFNGKNGLHIYAGLPRNYIPANRYRYYRSITGAFLCTRREDWNSLNGFCEDYQNSAEDVDLCFRMIKKNKCIAYNPKIEFIHHEGATLGICKSYDLKNVQLLKSRWGKFIEQDFHHYMLIDDYESTTNCHIKWFGDLPDKAKNISYTNLAPVIKNYKLEIGSGMAPQKGYIHCDIMAHAPHVDIVHDLTKSIPIADSSVCMMLANHVIEHISWRQIPFVLKDWYRIMSKNGQLVIRTPNLEFIVGMYKSNKITPEHKLDEDHIKAHFGGTITPTMYAILKLFSGQDYPSNFHNLCFDYKTLAECCIRAGFSKVDKLELPEFSPGEIQLMATK